MHDVRRKPAQIKGVRYEWRSVQEIKEEGLPPPIGRLATSTIGKETCPSFMAIPAGWEGP
jgi:hypothetical protein